MFTDKELAAYRNVKAPDGLKQKIVGKKKNYAKIISFVAAVAACFALIISGVAISNQSNIVINGQRLNNSVEFYYVSPAMKTTDSSTIVVPIEFNVRKETKISVFEGAISFDDSKPLTEIVIDSPKEILWKLEPQDSVCEFEMLITDQKGVQKVTLKYDNTKITVTKEKEK